MRYWADNPPAHVLLAAIHIKKSPQRKQETVNDLRSEVARIGGGIKGRLPDIYRTK